ncbi:MAG: isoprenylcysteine carboxylmethyltransferase family protein [Terriglobales bacterium]
MSQDAPQPGVQPSPVTWARVARRIRVPLSFLAGVAYIWLARPSWTSLLAGVLLAVPGLVLRALASGHVQKDRQLTTSGPYAYTRNPLYLGSLLMAAGFALAARSWWIVAIMLLIFVLIYAPVIAGEERFLSQTFSEYEEYARSVPRILPRLTPYRGQEGEYSSARYWKHREYQASLGCVFMLVILIVKLVLFPS